VKVETHDPHPYCPEIPRRRAFSRTCRPGSPDALAEDKTRLDREWEKMVSLKAKRLAAGGQAEAVRRRAKDASLVKKRTVTIGNRHTTMAIEDAFWSALKEIAASEKPH